MFRSGPGRRLTLRRLLTGGLVSILLFALIISAFGVGVLVRGYLWRSGVQELNSVADLVERRLGRRQMERRPGRARSVRRWGIRRSGSWRSQVLLLQDGRVTLEPEDSEIEWGNSFVGARPGVQILEIEGKTWQVLVRPLRGPDFDSFAVIRPWSPSTRITNALMTYQVMTAGLVLLLAVGAVHVLARRLTTPLEELKSWSERVGAGGGSEKDLSPSTVSEVAALQTSFRAMSERVEQALSSQRQFVADASHELKTPLTAIAGMLNLLESRPEMEPEDRSKALAVASKEADRMKTLVADLLVLSRAQAKHSGARTTVKLAEAAQEQLETLKVLFPQQRFEVELDPSLTWELNKDAFGRIVRNLSENAATHASGSPIKVKLFKSPEGTPCLQVIDNGPGIPSELQSQLFERFYRVDEGRSREAGGFGLGLPIVKALCEEAGGQIQCQSEPGRGTCFSVTFKPDDKGGR